MHTFQVDGGGSSTGARRVCAERSDPQHVDIGDMSREWKSSEAVRLDDGYTFECLQSKIRVTQMVVGIDGLAVVVFRNGPAANCLTSAGMGGLTLAQLRWMFSDWSNAALEEDGVQLSSILRNDNRNGVKEWSDLHESCEQVPINTYGAGDLSGTFDFFGEVVLCKNCFGQKPGYPPERFPECPDGGSQRLRAMDAAAAAAWIAGERPPNCYLSSEDDGQIFDWLSADAGGIAYFGLAHYNAHISELTVVRVASDRLRGISDTEDAAIAPSTYTVSDGSYTVFRRNLFMNVDNEAWPLVRDFMLFGFSEEGQREVGNSGYVRINVALWAKMRQRIPEVGVLGNPEADYVPVRPNSCRPGTELLAVPYTNAAGRDKVTFSCVNCTAGFFKTGSEATVCLPCVPGTFADQEGLSLCSSCDRGTYSAQNASRCVECGLNEFTASPGQSSCSDCPPGKVATEPGSWSCRHCPLGTYRLAEGPSCLPCPAGKTTGYLGAEAPDACMCSEGSYLGADNDVCLPCPEGMACPFGSSLANLMEVGEDCAVVDGDQLDAFAQNPERAFPIVEPGHMTLLDDRLRVFECAESSHCPGGCPQRCAPHRDTGSVACGKCESGAYEASDGCVPCEGADVLPTVAAVALCSLAFVVFVYAINRDVFSQTSAHIQCIALVGIMFSAVQSLGIFSQLEIQWYDPAVFILRIMRFMSFDLEILRVSCVLGNDPLVGFITRQCLGPASMPFVFATVAVQKHLQPHRHMWNDFLSATGSIFQVFFISMIVSGTLPMICYRHPGDVDNSMRSSPSILCFEGGTHTLMVIIGLCAMVAVPLPFLAVVIYGTRMYPRWVSSMDSAETFLMLKTYRFLFCRFTPEKYYFGIAILVRSLCVCLVPVVIHGDAAMQIMIMSTILSGFVLLQMWQQPWRHPVSNLLDGTICTLMCLLLLSGAMGIGLKVSMSSLAVLGTIAFALMLIIIVAALSYAVYRRMRPRPFYEYFICHHKADAGGQARLLKTLLQARTSNLVFIDCDDLKELDGLFDIVKRQVGCLVVYLTRDTLRRPWCAGEIASAVLAGVRIMQVKTPSFVPPTEEQLQDVYSYVDMTGTCLSKYHISMENVENALRQLLSAETAAIPLRQSFPGCYRFDALVNDLLSGRPRSSLRTVRSTSLQSPMNSSAGQFASSQGNWSEIPNLEHAVVFSSDPQDDEATAACGILKQKIQRRVFNATGCSIQCLADYKLELEDAMEGCTKYANSATPFIPVCMPAFRFPGENYYTDILPRFWNEDVPEARTYLEEFFKKIAVPLDSHTSDVLLEIQAMTVATRIQAADIGVERLRTRTPNSTSQSSEDIIHRISSRVELQGLPSESRTPSPEVDATCVAIPEVDATCVANPPRHVERL